jgi:hypothetical protein
MDAILSIVVMAAVLSVIGAAFLWRRNGFNRQVTLLLVLAVVMIANVLIWALPTKSSGTAAADRAAEGGPGD